MSEAFEVLAGGVVSVIHADQQFLYDMQSEMRWNEPEIDGW